MVSRSVQVKIKSKATFAYLRGVSDRVRKVGPREAWNLTQTGAKLIRRTHLETSQKYKGRIRSGINAMKLGKNSYGIAFSKQAMGLDSMRPHWVALKRGRLITQWARDRGLIDPKTGKLPRAIKVHKHPYINRGFGLMVNRLNSKTNKIANKIIRG